ncbi:AI-2E family transporter [bacterium]|nr:AI-2E family transporter [bacterium]
MRREQLFAAFFFVAFCFLLYQFYLILSEFIGPLSYAALLAFILQPLCERLKVLLRARDGAAAGLMTAATLLLVVAPGFYFFSVVTTESVSLYENLRDFVTSGRLQEMLDHMRASRLGQLVHDVGLRSKVDLPAMVVSASQTVSGFLVAQAPAAAANVFRFVINFFFTVFALFFFFRDGPRMVAALADLIPMEPEDKEAVMLRFGETLSAVVLGSVLTAAAQGLLGGVAYWGLGVPFSVLLAGATALLSLIPYAGPLVWIGVAGYLAIGGDYVRAGIMIGWGVLVIGSVDNFIRPLVIGGRTQIPTVFLFFGILGGLQAYGFLGMFLGPAIIAILVAFARIYREQYANDRPRRRDDPP